jgi:hypothetical protein
MFIDDYDIQLLEFVKKMNPKYFITFNAYPSSDDLIYDDTVGYDLNKTKTSSIVACTNDKKLVCFIKDERRLDTEHIRNLVDSKIGYLNAKDIVIIKSIFFCYDIEIDNNNLIKFNSYDEANKALFEDKAIKSLFVFQNHNNPLFTKTFADHKLNLYNFEDIDSQKVRFVLPNATLRNYNFRLSFKNYLDRYPVKTTLSFDNIIYCSSSEYNYLFDYLVLFFEDNYEYINYYSQNYKIHPRTLELLKGKDEKTMNKRHKTILEQFENKQNEFRLDIKYNLKGFQDTNNNTFVYNDIYIDGVPLKLNDKISLKSQTREIENGDYAVDNIDYNRDITILRRESEYEYTITATEDERDPRYMCYTDRHIHIKKLCESNYDTTGNPKYPNDPNRKDVWDRPCDTDRECPFFQKNTNYKNYRGGCINGYCELPLGLKRQGFRKHEGVPICHGCDSKYPSKCCDKQTNPDYAFEFDDYERLPEYVEKFIDTPLQGVKNTKQVSNDTYLEGDYVSVGDENVYHYELTNEKIDKPLKALKETQHKQKGDSLDMRLFLSEAVNSCFDSNTYGDPFDIYDINIKKKELSEDYKIATYNILFTIHRQGKSHGKRINMEFIQEITTGSITIKDIGVLGVIPEGDIKELTSSPNGVNELTSKIYGSEYSNIDFKELSTEDIFKPKEMKEYICDRAKKLKQAFNLDVKCDDI